MNVNEKALELKSKIMDSVQMWSDGLIDNFFDTHHLPKIAVKYIKRGRDNFIAMQDEAITKKINNALLFVTDKDGNYDLGMLSDDIISMLRDMPETPFDFGLTGTIGAGAIRIYIPEIPFVSSVFGDFGSVKITESDLLILKEMLCQQDGIASAASQTIKK